MLDIQLQIFKCVVEKESFSLAAQDLHLTQSSVSQQIHSLESYYGVKLFDRLHRRIRLTEAGAALYPFAVQLERLYQEANDIMRGQMDIVSGRLDIAASLTIGEYLIPEMLAQFNSLYPLVSISMTIENTEKVISKVIDGNVGIGFVEGLYEPVATLADRRCRGDHLVIIAPAAHPGVIGELTPLAAVMGERWVLREPNSGTRRVFEQFALRHGCDPSKLNVIMELSSTEAIKSAVKAGVGIGVMSCLAVSSEIERGELAIIPLREGAIERNFTMLHHRGKFQTRAVEKFSAFIMESLRL